MSLRHAALASLLDGDASGYELARRMEISVANFWHAVPSQLYAELRRLESDQLVTGLAIQQERRPNKRVYSLTEAGRAELVTYSQSPARPTAIKDELLIKVQAADSGDLEAVAAAVDERRATAELRVSVLDAILADFLRGRSEAEYLRAARRVGPYLNLRRGRDFERENIAWYELVADTLRRRADEGGRLTSTGVASAREA